VDKIFRNIPTHGYRQKRSSMYLESHPIYEASSCIPHSWFLTSAAWRLDDLHDKLYYTLVALLVSIYLSLFW